MEQSEEEWIDFVERQLVFRCQEQGSRGSSVLEVALDIRRRGICFGKPSLRRSQAVRYVPDGMSLIPPFTSIPGLGPQQRLL